MTIELLYIYIFFKFQLSKTEQPQELKNIPKDHAKEITLPKFRDDSQR